MDIISHASVLPWQIDGDFVMQVMQQAGSAVALLALVGVGYAVLHRLLSNQSRPNDSMQAAPRSEWPLGLRTTLQEEMVDEA